MPVVPQFVSVQVPGALRSFERVSLAGSITCDVRFNLTFCLLVCAQSGTGAPSVSVSYDWITSVLNHFCGESHLPLYTLLTDNCLTVVPAEEMWVLLKAQDDDSDLGAYSRADVCEVRQHTVWQLQR